MFSYSQDKQTLLVNSNLKSLEHQGNCDYEVSRRHRSQERLIRSLFYLPSYWKLVPCIDKRPLGRKWQDNYYSPQALFRSLEELVYSINPVYADTYDDWIRVGMALKDWDEGLSDLPNSLWSYSTTVDLSKQVGFHYLGKMPF